MSSLATRVEEFITRASYTENEGIEIESDNWRTTFVLRSDFNRGPVTKPMSNEIVIEFLTSLLRYIGVRNHADIAGQILTTLKSHQFDLEIVNNTEHGLTLRMSNPHFIGRLRAGEYFNNKVH